MQGALCFVLSVVMENAHADMRRIQAHALKNAFQNEPAEREEREKKKKCEWDGKNTSDNNWEDQKVERVGCF